MTILRHELRQGRRNALLWSLGCAFFILIGMTVFPRVKNNMGMVTKLLEGMGPLGKAFAGDRLDYGTLLGFYAAEAGNVLALGGGMFAALLGLNMLAKEEGRHTAEYLFPHPVSRLWVLTQKLAAMLLQLLFFSLVNAAASLLSFQFLGEPWDAGDFIRMQLGIYLLMLHLSLLCFGVSAFLSRDSIGLGIGLALLLYFINLLINMEVGIAALRYITPYYYTEPMKLLGGTGFDMRFVNIGSAAALGSLGLGFARYLSKDLRI